ncbi:hypothetical protein P3T76_014676 [Phytophthora citrophthora]|uniref:Uncharacterized protein n=1 Tax=Phytophthora citrophthora TaxID=4793 RepID=A0AAD9G1A6_9STRA|nr:hypothetical protein P3T76_014676 [Phytophthora citrophthora]
MQRDNRELRKRRGSGERAVRAKSETQLRDLSRVYGRWGYGGMWERGKRVRRTWTGSDKTSTSRHGYVHVNALVSLDEKSAKMDLNACGWPE